VLGTLKPQNHNQPGQLLDYNLRFSSIVLQALQAFLGQEPTLRDPSLADLGALILHLQGTYGEHASLEDVIQTLVAKDTERQLAARQFQLKLADSNLLAHTPEEREPS
jgi:hypothetical protein